MYKPRYHIDIDANRGGYKVTFYCALCDYSQTIECPGAASEAEALAFSDKQARKALSFNGCHRCGKWVCDAHFNMAKMTCMECSAADTADLLRRINAHSLSPPP